jgi:riboflavin synthase
VEVRRHAQEPAGLLVTTLRDVAIGQDVNVERAASEGAEIGGHPLSGHVDFTATIVEVKSSQSNKPIRFSVPESYAAYLFSQGYIAVDGVSLTISTLSKEELWFEVWLIPETRRATIIESLAPGDRVNIEIDRATQVVVDTIRSAVNEALSKRLPALEAALLRLGITGGDLIGDEEKTRMIGVVSTPKALRDK